MAKKPAYPVKFEVDYPKQSNRLTTFFRLILVIPIAIIIGILSGGSREIIYRDASREIARDGIGIAAALFLVTALMIVFRQVYPRWWFDFALELRRFSARVSAYFGLLTDRYPSTYEEQTVHLEMEYPDVKRDLTSWMPLFKWFLAIPHYFVLVFLAIGAVFATIFAWFAIMFTGRYPRGLFDYVVGVGRWGLRVTAYAFMLTTDKYPPFTLK